MEWVDLADTNALLMSGPHERRDRIVPAYQASGLASHRNCFDRKVEFHTSNGRDPDDYRVQRQQTIDHAEES